jgi:hypothetical protein
MTMDGPEDHSAQAEVMAFQISTALQGPQAFDGRRTRGEYCGECCWEEAVCVERTELGGILAPYTCISWEIFDGRKLIT